MSCISSMQLGKCWNWSYFWCLTPAGSHSLCCGCPGMSLTAGTPCLSKAGPDPTDPWAEDAWECPSQLEYLVPAVLDKIPTDLSRFSPSGFIHDAEFAWSLTGSQAELRTGNSSEMFAPVTSPEANPLPIQGSGKIPRELPVSAGTARAKGVRLCACFLFTPLQHTLLEGLAAEMVLKSLLWVVQTDLPQVVVLLPKSAAHVCLQHRTFCCSMLISPHLPLGFQGSVDS